MASAIFNACASLSMTHGPAMRNIPEPIEIESRLNCCGINASERTQGNIPPRRIKQLRAWLSSEATLLCFPDNTACISYRLSRLNASANADLDLVDSLCLA